MIKQKYHNHAEESNNDNLLAINSFTKYIITMNCYICLINAPITAFPLQNYHTLHLPVRLENAEKYLLRN